MITTETYNILSQRYIEHIESIYDNVKSSGHAFEEMVKELASLALHGTGVEIILQRDLNTLIKADELANEPLTPTRSRPPTNG